MSTQSQLTVLLTARARLQEAYNTLTTGLEYQTGICIADAREAGHDLPEEVHNLGTLDYAMSNSLTLLNEMIDRLNAARLSRAVKEML